MNTAAPSLTERIKAKLDIVDEIGAVVPLKKSGKAFVGLCPFHGERTPSFYVSPERQSWYCFGCHEGGDIFSFVMKQQAVDFPEALALLADRAGIAPDERGAGPGTPAAVETAARKRLRELNETAAIWFHHQLLQAPEAQYARAYLTSRGVSNESITLWRLGFAPDGDALSRYLREHEFSEDEAIEAGLVRRRDTERGGGLYDYFRGRVVFPIRDARGHTIAFGGRELGGGTPKYLNTPQTILFDKSATLYGLDLAREQIRRDNRVIIVEGYMDVIVPHQYGSRNVVACIGSAITEKHILQIKKLTRRVTLALDPDAAGESATLRGITVAQSAFDRVAIPVPMLAPERPGRPERERGEQHTDERRSRKRATPRGVVRLEEQVDAEITVMRLPAHEDPDEFVRRDPDGWRAAIAQAVPLIDYLIEAQTASLALDTPQGKMEARRRLVPVIAEVRDRVLADEYLDRLAAKLKLNLRDLQNDLQVVRQRVDREQRAHTAERRSTHDDGDTPDSNDVDSAADGRQPRAKLPTSGIAADMLAEQTQAEYCLGLLLSFPETWREIQAILNANDFSSGEHRSVFGLVANALQAQSTSAGLVGGPLALDVPPALAEVVDHARDAVSAVTQEGTALAKVASNTAYRLKRTRLKSELTELDYLQRNAIESGDPDAMRVLLRRKQDLLLQRRAIDTATGLYG